MRKAVKELTKIMSAPTHESNLKKWQGFADYYAEHFEAMTIQPARTLCQVLKLDAPEVERVLEVASGAGTCSREIAQRITPTAKFAAHDFTPEMVAKTRAALAKVGPVSEELFSAQLSANRGNGEDLVDVASDSIDRYLSNLCLMLVPDHTAMLKETFRVLKKGGSAAFTIWGDKTMANFFTTIPKAFAKHGVPSDTSDRSNFHLGQDDEALRQEFLDAGFSQVTIWHQFAVFEHFDVNRLMDTLYSVPSMKAMFSSACEKTAMAIREEAIKSFQNDIDQGRPIGFDTILIVARK